MNPQYLEEGGAKLAASRKMIQTAAARSSIVSVDHMSVAIFKHPLNRLTAILVLLCLSAAPLAAEGSDSNKPKLSSTSQPPASAKQSPALLAKSLSFSDLSNSELEKRVRSELSSLGSFSIGLPNNGRLLNGVQPSDGPLFEIVAEDFCWGTEETLRFMETAARAVHDKHTDTPPLHVGHLSGKSGGYLSPHLSHQSGRDVDLGYYYSSKRAWYRRATAKTLDVERTWTLVRTFITSTDVEMILIDGSIQRLLRAHAEKIGEDAQWLKRVFRGSAERPALIRHVRGHATHMHVRFFNPEAQRNAQRAYPFLLDQELVKPVVIFTHHRVRKGETLGRIARKYRTTVRAIQNANGLRSTKIQARVVYKIPRRGGPTPLEHQLKFPPRELP